MTAVSEKKIQLLIHCAFYAEQHFEIWMALEKCTSQHPDSYNEYCDFFGPSRRAHFESMLMAICSIFDARDGLGCYYFDDKRKQYRYGNFIEGLENRSIITKRRIQKLKTILRQNSKLINRARTIRDKHFAHVELTIEESLKKARLTKKRCASLVKIAGQVVNETSRACGEGSYCSEQQNGGYTLFRLLGGQKNV